MGLKDTLENNIWIVVAGTAIGAFALGWGVPEALRKNNHIETIAESELTELKRRGLELEDCKKTISAPICDSPESVNTVVAIVDNVSLVYDIESKKKGRTNFDDIYESLRGDKSLQLRRVQTYEGWTDFDSFDQLEPNLVILHASAFYSSTKPRDEEQLLQGFLSHVASMPTKPAVVVYSRSIGAEDEGKYVRAMLAKIPALNGRLYAFHVPQGRTESGNSVASFRTTANSQRLREKILVALGSARGQ